MPMPRCCCCWRDNIAACDWQQHGFMDKAQRDERGIPIDYTRWYFQNDADAEGSVNDLPARTGKQNGHARA